MAKKKQTDIWWVVGVLLASVTLYYLQTGVEPQSNSSLIPDLVEDRIDRLVAALNCRLGKQWVDLGAGGINYYLQNTLPASLLALVDTVVAAEMAAKHFSITGAEKKRYAVHLNWERTFFPLK